MIRLYIEGEITNPLLLHKKHTHYLYNVMRKRKGDTIIVFNELNGEWECEISEISKNKCLIELVSHIRAHEYFSVKLNNTSITTIIKLYFAPIKTYSTSFIVQKATEFGVNEIQPIITNRSVVKNVNTEKLRDTAIEASEQCGRIDIPVLLDSVKLNSLLNKITGLESSDVCRIILFFVPDVSAKKLPEICHELNYIINNNFKNLNSVKLEYCIFIGPEGGFEDLELHTNCCATNCYIFKVNINKFTLRAESAILGSLGIVSVMTDFLVDFYRST